MHGPQRIDQDGRTRPPVRQVPAGNEKGATVARYVILLNWTDQGVATVKDTVTRYGHARQLLESMGGSFESIAWTVGPYDLVSIVEAPDEQTVAAFTLQLASGGNLRSLTMRAFTEDEMTGIIEKLD